MNLRSSTGRIILAGSLSVLLGLLYLGNVPGLEADAMETARLWGAWSVFVGVLVFAGAFLVGRQQVWISYGTALALAVVFVMQIFPVSLWVVFNREPVGDNPSASTGNWIWAVPHVVLAILATMEGRRLLYSNDQGEE